ncbi:MAG: Gfo/Idh/MocA family oxidoreductase [Candidatus Eisenbacteria bacterium]|nr:Gfo/Idh/MocA family oxidoreductase [Candidatus Eisenbacteria bacterium]
MVDLALLGVGAWGKNLLRTFLRLRNATLRTVCDPDLSRCHAALNGARGVEVSADAESVLSDPSIAAVAIASSARTHFDLARRAILSGKDVFVEKPMTLSVADAEELVRLAEAEHRVLMVGHLLIYHPAVEKMKQLVTSGEVGKVYYLYSQRLNLGRIRTDENALWSFAPHDISVALHVLGDAPVEVAARGAAYIQPGIEDVAFLHMRFRDDRLAQVHVSWLDPHKVRRTTLVGSEKMVVFDDAEPSEKIRIYDRGVDLNGTCVGYSDSFTLRFGEVTAPVIDMVEPLKAECAHFIDCVEARTKPRTDGRDGLRVVRVLDAAERSLRNGGLPVPIE